MTGEVEPADLVKAARCSAHGRAAEPLSPRIWSSVACRCPTNAPREHSISYRLRGGIRLAAPVRVRFDGSMPTTPRRVRVPLHADASDQAPIAGGRRRCHEWSDVTGTVRIVATTLDGGTSEAADAAMRDFLWLYRDLTRYHGFSGDHPTGSFHPWRWLACTAVAGWGDDDDVRLLQRAALLRFCRSSSTHGTKRAVT
jgi:hypothetical protein